MTELWRVWGQECRALLADRALLLTLFGGILFYAYLYPLPYSHQVARQLPVLLVDEDDSLLSRRLAFMADATPQLQLVGRAHTLSEAESRIRHGEAKGLLLIPRHFYRDVRLGRTVTLGFAGDGAYYLIYGAIAEGLSSAATTLGAQIRISRLLAQGQVTPAAKAQWRPFAILAEPVFNRPLGYQQYVVPAVFLFILHQTLLIGLGLRGASDHQLRQAGLGCSGKVWPRQLARTLLFMGIYLGFTLFYLGPCLAWYGLNRLADPLQLLGFLLPFFLAASQLGLIFGSYLTRREMATPIIILSSLPLLFATGFIWPQEMLPWPIQGVMTLIPATPGILGSLRLNGMGADWSAVSGFWGQRWLQALGYGLLAWWRLRSLARSRSSGG